MAAFRQTGDTSQHLVRSLGFSGGALTGQHRSQAP